MGRTGSRTASPLRNTHKTRRVSSQGPRGGPRDDHGQDEVFWRGLNETNGQDSLKGSIKGEKQLDRPRPVLPPPAAGPPHTRTQQIFQYKDKDLSVSQNPKLSLDTWLTG